MDPNLWMTATNPSRVSKRKRVVSTPLKLRKRLGLGNYVNNCKTCCMT